MSVLQVAILLVLCTVTIYAQSDSTVTCTSKLTNPLSMYITYFNKSSTVQMICADRAPINCFFYTPYRFYMCRSGEEVPCNSPSYALIDGKCCDIGKGCPLPSPPTPVDPVDPNPVDPNPPPQPPTDSQLESRVEDLENNLVQLKNVLETQGKTISTLQGAVTDQSQTLAALHVPIGQNTRTLEELYKVVANQGQALSKVQNQNSAIRKTISALVKALKTPKPPKPLPPPPPTKPSVPIPIDDNSEPSTPDALTNPMPSSADRISQQRMRVTVMAIVLCLGILGIVTLVIAIVVYKRRQHIHHSARE